MDEMIDHTITLLHQQYLALLHQGPIPEAMHDFQKLRQMMESWILSSLDQRNKDKLAAALTRYSFEELNKQIRAAHSTEEEDEERSDFFVSWK
jgi:hypothetical protein